MFSFSHAYVQINQQVCPWHALQAHSCGPQVCWAMQQAESEAQLWLVP